MAERFDPDDLFDDDGPGILDDFDLFDDLVDADADTLETTHKPNARKLRLDARRRMMRMAREEGLRDILDGLPARGEQIHIVSAAKFDYWTWAPVLVDWLRGTDLLYCSTWALSRPNARQLFELCDAGLIRGNNAAILTGTYFKRRETEVYSYLVAGLRSRGGRFRAFANHSKVLLLANAKQRHWLTIESSANLTGNPRVEQYVLTNDRALHDFHLDWMTEVLDAEARADA